VSPAQPTTIVQISGLYLSQEKALALRKRNGLSSSSSCGELAVSNSGAGEEDIIHEDLVEARKVADELRTELASTRIAANNRLEQERQLVKSLMIEVEKLKHDVAIANAKTEAAQATISLLEAEKSNAEWVGVKSPKSRAGTKTPSNEDGDLEEDMNDALKQAEQTLRDIESDE
jgi:hypothetical protein